MSTKKISKMTVDAANSLKKAVRKEIEKKALLGQYVIINKDGKACRIHAKEALSNYNANE